MAGIIDRMEDCGDGRHVGWWMENLLRETALLVEVQPTTVTIACCERVPEKRVHFITSRKKAIEIVRAMAKALDIPIQE